MEENNCFYNDLVMNVVKTNAYLLLEYEKETEEISKIEMEMPSF